VKQYHEANFERLPFFFFLMILKTERRQQKKTAFLAAERVVCSAKYENTIDVLFLLLLFLKQLNFWKPNIRKKLNWSGDDKMYFNETSLIKEVRPMLFL